MATTSTPVDQSTVTATIMNELIQQANAIVGAANNVTLSPINAGSTGLFPYYWSDPSNTDYNSLTFGWIDQCVVQPDGATPVAFASTTFQDQYIDAITSISYSLSTDDQSTLNKAAANATNQQGALLNAWKAAYKTLPPPSATTTPIDDVINVILSTWVTTPGTTLGQLQSSKNAKSLLANMPASGAPIYPVFISYLNSMASVLGLLDIQNYKNGYLQAIRNAVNLPSAANGAVQLNTTPAVYAPNYLFNTSMDVIINGLTPSVDNSNNTVTLSATIEQYSGSQVSLSVGADTCIVASDWFFDVAVNNQTDYFQQNVVENSSSILIQMEFNGVTAVEYGPMTFDYSTGLGWFDPSPIQQAIANGNSDVSGYKFNPVPNIDFSQFGTFGLSTAVVIANAPTISITITSENYESFASDFNSSSSLDVSLGCFGMSASANYSAATAQVDASSQSVTVTMSPPPQLVAGTAVTSTAFVMGIQTEYPAS